MQRYFRLFNRDLIGSRSHQWCGIYANNSNFHGKVNIRCFSQPLENHENTYYGRSKKKDFNISDLIQHINKGRVFYLKQLTNVFHTIDFDQLKTDEAVLLLKHCGCAVADSSREKRNKVCQDIYKCLQQANNVDSNIFNQYIKTCTENSILIYKKELLLKYKPDKDTYKLLLENVCQFGKVKDTFEILELMKDNNISLDSDSVNNLVLAYTIEGGLKSGEAVLRTIKTAHIEENSSAKLALFKGLIRRKDLKEFKKAKEDFPVSLTEYEFLDFIQELGLNGQDSWLEEVPNFYNHIDITRDLQIKIEKICIHLIHMGQPFSAMNLYKKIVVPHPAYGVKILREMLHCDCDISNVILMAKNLVETDLNSHILENLTELALRFKYEEQAWALLDSLEVVRPHYFWPLLIQNARRNGEYGIFSVLKRINKLQVKLDSETLEEYVLPYCDLADSKLLMLKLQDVGFSVREILSPFLVVLLKYRKTKKASELCKFYNVKISGENFVPLLAKTWIFTKDSASIFTVLSRYCESNPLEQDTVGSFLLHIARNHNQEEEDFHAYLKLLQVIGKNRLRISIHTADVIQEIFTDKNLQSQLEVTLRPLVDLGLNISDDAVIIAHPRTMNLEGLENHLIELQEKNMEIRGVLRRLIQMHANKGNLQRVKELRQLFLERGYEESPGMKSAIMHSYALGNHLDETMNLYGELKTIHPEFRLDHFKFIDLVKILIDNERFEEGFNILKDELSNCKKVKNKQSIERNCRNLLSVCKNAEQLDKIFNVLLENELCVISNILLGPLVRIHLKSGDIDKAVERYIELSRKYNCTPVQFEVMCAVAERQDAGQLQRVVKATEAVHGVAQTQVGLIAALAENGQGNALRKTLINVTSPIQGLLKKRCTRWVEERKLEPLKCLANACDKLPQEFADVDFINRCILEIYDLNGDYSGALKFVETLPEDSRSITLEHELQMLRDKQTINSFSVNITNTG